MSINAGNKAAQYPPGIAEGELDYLQGWSSGYLSIPSSDVCPALDGPVVAQHDASCYQHCEQGLLAVSINVQSLRGQMTHAKTVGGISGPASSGADEVVDGDSSFKGRSKKKLVLWQLRQRRAHIVGVQEARPYSSCEYEECGFLIFSSKANAKGGFGCMCLLSTSMPWAMR